jgi:tRNA(fMet)-specific endonuclease VapC
MLDTNICIYLIKQKTPTLLARLRQAGVDQICLSAITLAELSYGVEKSTRQEQNRMALRLFLVPLEIFPFPPGAALIYGKIRADLESKGTVIGAYDMLIAAHALTEGLTLVTNNTGEYSRIEGLPLENWL